MRVLLDANIVLDLLLARLPWQAEATAILQAHRESRLTTLVTSLTIANVFYVGRRHAGLARARHAVRECLDVFEVVGVDRATLLTADSLPGSDFEDNVQMAAGVQAGADAVVTRDPAGFVGGPLLAVTPQELLVRLQAP